MMLTASGGPFRTYSSEQLADVTVADALSHPTWSMGPKITVDSATLMNKALEIIEARWLFDLRPEQIAVVIHPQSIVHSMVEYIDGSVIAQLSPPDMKLPIQYALTWPERREGVAARLDWSRAWHLDFEPPDLRAVRRRWSWGLRSPGAAARPGRCSMGPTRRRWPRSSPGELGFTQIVPACRAVFENHDFDPQPSLERLFELDRWARQEVTRWVCT